MLKEKLYWLQWALHNHFGDEVGTEDLQEMEMLLRTFLEFEIWKVKLKATQDEGGIFFKVANMKFETWPYTTTSDLTLLKYEECSHLICELQIQEHLIHKAMLLLYSLLNLEA